MARVFPFQSIHPGIPQSLESVGFGGGVDYISRTFLPSAGCQIPVPWRSKAVVLKTRVWLWKSSLPVQGCASKGYMHGQTNASNRGSAEHAGRPNCKENGNGAIETVDFMHDEIDGPGVEDCTSIGSPDEQPSMRFPDDGSEGKSIHANIASAASNISQNLLGNGSTSEGPESSTSAQESYFTESEKSYYFNLNEYEAAKAPKASSDEGVESVSDSVEGDERDYSESKKPSYVSLVWEAGSRIEGITSDTSITQDGNETNDESFSLVIDNRHHAKEKLTALEQILATFPKSEQELNSREAEMLSFTNKLLTQSSMSQEAYVSSQEALNTAEGLVSQLQTQVDQLKEDVTSRDTLLRLLQKEGSLSSQSLQRAAESLADAERKIMELERRVQVGEENLCKERDKLTTSLRLAGLHEQALRVAELKVAELTTEIASLKELVATGRGTEQLVAQVKNLEQEVRSRDVLLLEIKQATIRSTDALKLAAQIKQDLNATRQREIQLTQSLESANEVIKELQRELTQNVRAVRAEQVLKQTEKMLNETKSEVEFLRKGVEARDKAIHIMQDEMDLNIAILGSAARDREELRKMNRYAGELKTELDNKDAKLSLLREEMAFIINLAKQQQSSSAGSSTSINASSMSAPSPVQEVKSKRKTTVRTQTTPVRKKTGPRGRPPRAPSQPS